MGDIKPTGDVHFDVEYAELWLRYAEEQETHAKDAVAIVDRHLARINALIVKYSNVH